MKPEIERAMREALEAADECLALIEDVGHGAMMDDVTVARRMVLSAISSANAALVPRRGPQHQKSIPNQTQPNNEAGVVVQERLVRPDAFRVKCSPHWSPREMEVIEELAIAKGIEPCQVVRCALRLYQMEHEGTITTERPEPVGCPDFPDEVSGTNANVDLPDTTTQDSASKSNSPAVSG